MAAYGVAVEICTGLGQALNSPILSWQDDAAGSAALLLPGWGGPIGCTVRTDIFLGTIEAG